MSGTTIVELIPRTESLRTMGIGVKHFPKYVNLEETQHTLDIILLSLIVKGEVTHHLDDESYPESDMSLSIVNYGQKHTITTTSAGAEVVNIYLDLRHATLPLPPPPLSDWVPLFLPIHFSMQNKLNRMTRVKFTENDNILPLLKEMEMELSRKRPGYETVVNDFMRVFLVKIARRVMSRHVTPSAELNTDTQKRLERLRLFLDQHYKKQFSLDELAKTSGFSPNYLCRVFKSHTGKTITNYLNERRVRAAMLLLSSTSKRVIDVAAESGFCDVSHFNHVFKRKVGVSPVVFRKNKHLAISNPSL